MVHASAKRFRSDRGLTIIELMVVCVVLGMLVGLVLLGVQPFKQQAIAAACRSEIDSLRTANAAYIALMEDVRHGATGS